MNPPILIISSFPLEKTSPELKGILTRSGLTEADVILASLFPYQVYGDDMVKFIHKTNPAKTPPGFTKLGEKYVSKVFQIEREALIARVSQLRAEHGLNLAVVLGDAPFLALSGLYSVDTWRGSELYSNAAGLETFKIIPSISLETVRVSYPSGFLLAQDIKRARLENSTPLVVKAPWVFKIAPTFAESISYLESLLLSLKTEKFPIVVDLEIKNNVILCVGLATSKLNAFCLPFIYKNKSYFSTEEFVEVISLLREVLTHENCEVANQNLAFDIFFLYNRFLIYPKATYDTMLAHHILLPATAKALEVQASFYCEHYRYWKDDGKFWKDDTVTEEELWYYNCEDCVRTFEVMEEQKKIFLTLPTKTYALEFQHKVLGQTIRMTLKGVKVDLALAKELRNDLMGIITTAEGYFQFVSMSDCSISSPKQLQNLFYTELKVPAIRSKKGSRNVTTDAEAIDVIEVKYPLISHLCTALNLVRSYSTSYNTAAAGVDADSRWRCSYIVPGTDTYRFSSRKNPFGTGLNLQNITKGD